MYVRGIVTIEEFFEMWGAVMFLYTLLSFLEACFYDGGAAVNQRSADATPRFLNFR